MTLQISIQTKNGEYILWKPKGDVGVEHMAMLLKFYKEVMKLNELGIENVLESEEIFEIFKKWCKNVLPNIIIKSPFKYEDIPYSDMYIIFNKVFEEAIKDMEAVGVDSFREE